MSASPSFRLTPAAGAICLLAHLGAHAQTAASPPSAAASAPAASESAPAEPTGVSALTTVVVSGQRATGFTSNVIGVGAFRDQRPIDVPLTNSVITRDVLDAQGSLSVLDAVRNTAGVTTAQLGSAYYDNLAIRGVPMENRSSYRLDGSLPLIALVPIPMEDKERVEVLKGASSMYYGMVPPAGIISFEMKRAGPAPVTSLTTSVNQYGAYEVGVDVGRRFGENEKFGLRINALGGTDNPGLHQYQGQRNLFSAAFDFRMLDNVTVKVDFEHYVKNATEQASVQLIGTATTLPQVPDNRTNLAGKWGMTRGQATNGDFRVDWDVTDNWRLTAEYGASLAKRDREFTQFAFNDISGYQTGVGRVFGNFNNGATYQNTNTRLDLSGRLETGPIAHELTFGWTQNDRKQDIRGTNVQSWGCATLSATCSITSAKYVGQNLYDPIAVPLQTQKAPNGPQATDIEDKGLYAVDRVILSKQWQVMVGLRRTDYTSGQTNPVSATPMYSSIKTTPAYSLIYEPVKDMSIYASHLQGLEAGVVVPGTYSNSGALLPAALTTQNEIGSKYQFKGGTLIQGAFFDIRRAQTTSEPAPAGSTAPPSSPGSAASTWLIQTQNGQAEYKGFELAASGEVNRNIGIVASAMFLDPKITRDETTGPTNTQGHTPGNAAKRTFSLFGEYRFDAVPGLAVNAAAYYVGARPVSNADVVNLPAVTTYSVGARYRTKFHETNATFQVNVDNATNKSYWSAADATSANPIIAAGLPRVIRMTAKLDF